MCISFSSCRFSADLERALPCCEQDLGTVHSELQSKSRSVSIARKLNVGFLHMSLSKHATVLLLSFSTLSVHLIQSATKTLSKAVYLRLWYSMALGYETGAQQTQITETQQTVAGSKHTQPYLMDGLMFSDRTVGVDKGAEWHEQLNSFLMKHNLSFLHKLDVEAIIDRAKQQYVEQFRMSQ